MLRRSPRSSLLGLAACAAGLALSAPAAEAIIVQPYVPTGVECRLVTLLGTDVEGRALADPLGYVYDTGALDNGYATLDEGSTLPLLAGLLADDAWDRFGALFVGPSRSTTTIYRDAAENASGCSSEAAGRQTAFKTVRIGGLDVRRRLFVSAGQGSGVRLLDSITNATAALITTGVYVGDLRADSGGSLGSDGTTRITATSSADTALSTADRWATTGDGRNFGPDPALAHVWGGEGGEDTVDFVRSGAQAGGAQAVNLATPLDADQLGWGWEDVTVAPGETRSFLSWETMRATLDGKASSQTAAASAAAADQSSAPLPRVYEGLTQAQIGGIRNWAKPPVDAIIDPVGGASAAADTTLSARGLDFGSSTLAACTSGTLTWDFGDGTTATGQTVTHRFSPGTAQVALTVQSTCGASAVRQVSFTVTAPPTVREPAPTSPTLPAAPTTTGDGGAGSTPPATAPQAAAPAPSAAPSPAPGPVAAAAALTLDVAPKLSAGELARRGVRPTLLATAPGTVRLVLSGGGLKIVKTKQVAAGTVTPAAMKLGPKDGKRVRGLKTLQLRAKLTLADGTEVVSAREITVGK